MTIWSAEIKELETLHGSLSGQFPELKKELGQLIRAKDENVILLYARRSLEVIVSDLCEKELNRPRKTEPLKGIIDKLNKEEKVPSHIITSMLNLNSLSVYGTHPKDFDPQQVRPVLVNLATIIKWYQKYINDRVGKADKEKPGIISVQDAEEVAVPAVEPKQDSIFRILWKKGVPQLMAGYFLASWVIIRVLDWMLSRYDLSTHWTDIILIALLAMFPSVLLYFYNRERINRGRLSLAEKITFPSNLVLVILLILLLSKGTRLSAMTDKVTVVNEYGKKEKREVLKEEYVHRITILPFKPEEPDSVNDWLEYGITEGIWADLVQFPYILTYQNMEAVHLEEQRKEAEVNRCPYFLTGSFRVEKGSYLVTGRLHETANGSVKSERVYRGNDLLNIFDSISLQTRIDLGVPAQVIRAYPDLPFKEHTTGSIEAFRHFILGYYNEGFYKNLNAALEFDSTFALASFFGAQESYGYQHSLISTQKYINHAMHHRRKLCEYFDFRVRVFNYLINGQDKHAMELLEMQYKLQPYNSKLLEMLVGVYTRNAFYGKAAERLENLNEMIPRYPTYQLSLTKAYLRSGQIDKGLRYIKKMTSENPEHTGFLLYQGIFYIHKGDLNEAEKTFRKGLLLSPDNPEVWSLLLDHVEFTRKNTITNTDLRRFTGRYRTDGVEQYSDFSISDNHLFAKPATQEGWFKYPLADTSFLIAEYIGPGGLVYVIQNFQLNDLGKVYKLISNFSFTPRPIINWHQDSLILRAEALLVGNRCLEALAAFREAYTKNPEHYYLENYIRHLEFILGPEYETIRPVMDSYTGEYAYADGTKLKIYTENDQFCLNDSRGLIYKLLPLSETQFMVPSSYNCLYWVEKEDDTIRGLKRIWIDGENVREEDYFERVNDSISQNSNNP